MKTDIKMTSCYDSAIDLVSKFNFGFSLKNEMNSALDTIIKMLVIFVYTE